MPPCTEYFQITGINAHSHSWDIFNPWNEGNVGLARAIATHLRFGEPPAITLILGIWPSGASCLLLSLDHLRVFCNDTRLPTPRRAPCAPTEFLSLSPISFHDEYDLLKRLKTYAPKAGKKGNAEVGDTSQANKGYMRAQGFSAPGQPLPGVARSAFEHNRVLYALLQHTIDPHRLGLPYFPWAAPSEGSASADARLRIVSLAINTWASDKRKLAERLRAPEVLDIGWSERYAPEGSTVHIKVKEKEMMGQGYKPAPFDHGETQFLPQAEIAKRLRELFGSFSSGAPAQPVVLLVHGAQVTHAVLQACGVNMDACVVGIRELLLQGPLVPIHQDERIFGQQEDEDFKKYRVADTRRSVTLDYGEEDVKYRRPRERSRSRSPKRESRTLSPRRPSPPRRHLNSVPQNGSRRLPGNVYIVDVQELYQRLTQTDGSSSRRVSDTARALGITGTNAGWCAGNECRTMFDIWTAMASGPPIDEQRAARLEPAPLVLSAVVEDAPKAEQDDEDDDERDPNDVIANHPSVDAGVGGGMSGDPYANIEDDDDDDWD
ncbi:hypothetical protein FIBSPDRAFT_925830 [Athelia psychrophila]|uniref:Uncharacterized protein n=1 Tax=Athelia psychrophila TaxID=1759441 RepID=A0A166UEE1_9AGAM|nr:hypothetical protein FIBSPDRAFT_925830 [Fibularhizoctonia sp. CBS 109695]